jgi:hypothetical protein
VIKQRSALADGFEPDVAILPQNAGSQGHTDDEHGAVLSPPASTQMLSSAIRRLTYYAIQVAFIAGN